MGSFSIKVECSLHGRPMTDTKVFISYSGAFAGTDTSYTDNDGWAEFWIEDGAEWDGDIYIKDENFSGYSFYDGRRLSFTVDCDH